MMERAGCGWTRRAIPLTLWLLCFCLLLRTMCATAFVGDSGEFIAAAYLLGVPHPTGYSLYMPLSHLFEKFIPLCSISQRMNLVSVVAGSLALLFMFLVLRRLNCSAALACWGALLLLLSGVFWETSTVTEVYPLNILFMAASLWLLDGYLRSGDHKLYFFLMFFLGLGLVHHGTFSFFAAPLLLFLHVKVFRRAVPLQMALIGVSLLLLAWSLLLYIPVRSTQKPWINWGQPNNWERFLGHITGQEFHKKMPLLKDADAAFQSQNRMRELAATMMVWLLPLTVYGAGRLCRQRQGLGVACLGMAALNLIFCLTYEIPDIEPFVLPSLMLFAMWNAIGADGLLQFLRRHDLPKALATGGSGLLLLGSWLYLCGRFGEHDLSKISIGYDFGIDILNTLAPNAEVRTQGWTAPFVLLALQAVERQRPDIILNTPLTVPTLGELDPNRPVYYISAQDRKLPLDKKLFPEGLCLREMETEASFQLNPWFERMYRIRPETMNQATGNFLIDAIIAQYFYRRAESRFLAGERTNASQDIAAAAQVGRLNARILNNVGNVCLKMDMAEQAIMYFTAARDLDPDLLAVWNNLGVALLKSGKSDEAFDAFRQCLLRGMNAEAMYETIGDVYFELGQYVKAVQNYLRVLTVSADTAEVFVKLGRALKRTGFPVEARVQFVKAVAANPELPEAYLELGRLDLEHEDCEQAIAQFEKSRSLTEHDPVILNLLGNAWLQCNRPDTAELFYHQALDLAPRIEFYNNLGALYIQTGDYQKAADLYQEIIRKAPTLTAAINNLGIARYNLGDLDGAKEAWEKSLQIEPNQPEIAADIKELQPTPPPAAKKSKRASRR